MSIDLKEDDSVSIGTTWYSKEQCTNNFQQVINRISQGFKPKEAELSTLDKIAIEKQKIINQQGQNFLEEIFRNNSQRAIYVSNVQIEGTEQFRDDFLTKQILPFINKSNNLNNLLNNIDTVSGNFFKSGAVENLAIQLTTGTGLNFKSGYYPENSIEIIPHIKLIPVKKFMAKTGTNIGNGEGDGYMTFQFRNIFGGGENLILDATTGTRTRSSYLLNYSSPGFGSNTNWKFDNSLFFTSRKIDWSSHEQLIKGMNNKIVSMNIPNGKNQDQGLINHEFSIENILRSITNVSPMASNNILFHAGDDFKTSFIYKFAYDSRNDRTLPTKGDYFSLVNEISGILPNLNTSKFLKQSFESQIARNFIDGDHIINLSLRGGWLYSLNKTTHLMDRFYLGGPNDIRGFFFNGLGPRNFNDTLGGDIFLSGGLSTFHRLPFVSKESNFKFHNFINFGRLIPLDKNENFTTTLKELINEPSIGIGTGIVFKHPVARFELNFVLPVTAHENDSIRKGLQYGIGLSFM
ncbi:Outer membrane protein assembly factor yaeT [Wickerhamomyces ciferrii]|uniref:Outer membrane protein assembly factor yaeT n=1 Tax=Wickerhamomyces ciferrii (strain ATCC 14091 / BCRC 22168 / CBS 111 / JCM 3599 / NBRC 0793 / NRRL Y-1031 F-60-10) TaxID=1206466 RepID=K0KKP3_WICCF|nr:Outer membrane protein assembly factor yaeT [Wickerhamomyces ciferrii]CCH42039.1 Outer membrane protein assembly factor yaeT [Wickerhamomyces ciferrii]